MAAIPRSASPGVITLTRPAQTTPAKWLDGRRFDTALIGGVFGLSMLSALAMFFAPSLFVPLLIADLWLLGYHHVIGTFARVSFETDGFKRYRALFTWVPAAVIVAVAALALGVGAWTLPTIYLYWQWWHYTRQSYGVAQLYRLKTGDPQRSLREMMAVVYLLPITGILFRSLQAPQEFLDVELKTIPMIPEVVTGFAIASIITLGIYAVRQAGALREGTFSLPYNAFLATHLIVFAIAYFTMSINHGWLVVNVWHNSQYLLMVWLFNNKQFKDQLVPDRPFASKLSQRKHVMLFFGATLALSTVAYLFLGVTVAILSTSALPIALMTYQSINFHHYIVDSFIWKSRRPKVREELDIKAAA
jgi:hypothetical protein